MTEILHDKPYIKYAEDILTGRIKAGQYVIKACERFMNDFARDDIYFNYKLVDHVIAFAGILKHFNSPIPEANGKNIELSPFHVFVVANIMGWWVKEDGRRRYHISYIEVARKNAKTMIQAIIGFYELISSQKACQIYLTANSREQAGYLLEFMTHYAEQLDPSGKEIKVRHNKIKVESTGAYCMVLSSDHSRSDGGSVQYGIIDEAHEMKDTSGLDVLRSGAVSLSSHVSVITTAGFDRNSPCYALRETAIDVVMGNKQDDSYFVLIYGLDSDMDWKDESNWICASPNIGISVPWSFYRAEFQAAVNSPTQELNFRTKNLNEWLSVASVYIPGGYIDKVMAPIDMNDWQKEYVALAVDLSSYSDITAVNFTHFDEKKKIYEFKNFYFLPETCLNEGPNAQFYTLMKKEGYLITSNGNCVDYDAVADFIINTMNKYKLTIRKIGFDVWNSYQFQTYAMQKGLPPSLWEAVPQSLMAMNSPTKFLEQIILDEQCVIDYNPITKWMFENTQLKVDWNGNVKPDKSCGVSKAKEGTKAKKIDGVIAMIMGLQTCMKYIRNIAWVEPTKPNK